MAPRRRATATTHTAPTLLWCAALACVAANTTSTKTSTSSSDASDDSVDGVPPLPAQNRFEYTQELCFDIDEHEGCVGGALEEDATGCRLADGYYAKLVDSLVRDLMLEDDAGAIDVSRECARTRSCMGLRKGYCGIEIGLDPRVSQRPAVQLTDCAFTPEECYLAQTVNGLISNERESHNSHEGMLPWMIIAVILIGLGCLVAVLLVKRKRDGMLRNYDSHQHVVATLQDEEEKASNASDIEPEEREKILAGIPPPLPPPPASPSAAAADKQPTPSPPRGGPPPPLPPTPLFSRARTCSGTLAAGSPYQCRTPTSPMSLRQMSCGSSFSVGVGATGVAVGAGNGSSLVPGGAAFTSAGSSRALSPTNLPSATPRRRVSTAGSVSSVSQPLVQQTPFKPNRVMKM